jgi:hypothetical protein
VLLLVVANTVPNLPVMRGIKDAASTVGMLRLVKMDNGSEYISVT